MKLEPLRQKLRAQQRALPEAFEVVLPPIRPRSNLLNRLLQNVIKKDGIKPRRSQPDLWDNLDKLASQGFVRVDENGRYMAVEIR